MSKIIGWIPPRPKAPAPKPGKPAEAADKAQAEQKDT